MPSFSIMSAPETLDKTSFDFNGQTGLYHGKVRDVYTIDDKLIVMIISDRVSAFDCILPRAIPFKGQVLNSMAEYFLNATHDIVPNWKLAVPDPNVMVGINCRPFKVEMVIRGYLTGHAWRVYNMGKRELCGVAMPDGMKENDKFPEPIITPTTKSDHGHDEDISKADILKKKIVSKHDYEQLENYTRLLYARGSEMAKEKGLILVDTKYEFGKSNDRIFLIDEVHTPDSSRYFYAEGYEARQQAGEPQKQLSKEFLRQWLIKNNFQGLEGQKMPIMSDEVVNEVSNRYIELFEKITGKSFVRSDSENILSRIEKNVSAYLTTVGAGI